MKKLSLCALGTITLFYVPLSFAEITFNGFASIRASQANSDGGDPPFNVFEEGELSFKSESLFAIQASADLSEGLTATIQLYADGPNDFDVEARWAYLNYEAADNHSISVGKLANPMFHQSEYEKVGYAHNFSRLPKAVYTGFDFSTVEGISLNSQFEVSDGDYTLDTKLLYGNWDGDIALNLTDSIPLSLKDIMSFNTTLSGDWWKIFAGAFVAEIEGETFDQALFLANIQPGIQAALAYGASQSDVKAFTDAVIWHEKDGLYWYTGFGIEHNNWIVDFEYSRYGINDSVDTDNRNWFLAVGYRFDNYVITIHKEESEQPADYSFLNNVSHPVLVATGQSLQDGFSDDQFDGIGITLRYDFHPSAALKVDYFTGENMQPSVDDYQIMSVGVDLVF